MSGILLFSSALQLNEATGHHLLIYTFIQLPFAECLLSGRLLGAHMFPPELALNLWDKEGALVLSRYETRPGLNSAG